MPKCVCGKPRRTPRPMSDTAQSGNVAHRSPSRSIAAPRVESTRISIYMAPVIIIMNSKEYREKLIDEVKKYPVLYDTNHENHRDVDVRDRCWQEISDRLGANCKCLYSNVHSIYIILEINILCR